MTTDVPINFATGRSKLGSVACFFLVFIGLKLRLPFWSCKEGGRLGGSLQGVLGSRRLAHLTVGSSVTRETVIPRSSSA